MFPMTPHALATEAGLLPVRKGPIRFAVGSPDGLTSNAWRIWTEKKGDVYIRCRDNFQDAKVSLHASGRWRIGFAQEALAKNPGLVQDGQNRAWDVWDEPPAALPNVVKAFKLVFPASELTVRPDQRVLPSKWSNVLYIEAPPPGKLTVVTLFVTTGDLTLTHPSEPSFHLASLDIDGKRRAHLVAHGEPEGDFMKLLEKAVIEARQRTIFKGIDIPAGAYGYFLGQSDDGCRFVFGARMTRAPHSHSRAEPSMMANRKFELS
jgi:hypothetical protein